MKQIDGDALRGHLETLVLAVLEKGAAHGYEIVQRIEERAAGALELREGSVYPALHRMEDAGLIAGEWEKDSGRRGPRRRVYALTPKGKRTLADGRTSWKQFVKVIGRIVEAPNGST